MNATAQPKKTAQPKPKAPPKANAASRLAKLKIVSLKDQDAFDAQAVAMCEQLGWTGQADWELNGIQNSDARAFLRKTLHEAHQGALNDGRKKPTAEAVCQHLGLDKDALPYVAEQLKLAAAP